MLMESNKHFAKTVGGMGLMGLLQRSTGALTSCIVSTIWGNV